MVRALARPRWNSVLAKSLADFPRDVNEMFEQFFQGHNGPGASTWAAPLSLWEEEGNFFVDVDMAGVAGEAIDITVEKNELRITAERKTPEGERKYWYQERGYGKIERVLVLPDTVDADSIEAELKDGVLHVRLAKRAENQPKKITVKSN